MRHLAKFLQYLFLLTIAAFTAFPIWWIFSTSLESLKTAFVFPAGLVPHGDWRNYLAAWHMAPWLRFFGNTLFISGTTVVLAVLTSVLAAFAFAFLKWRGKGWLFAAVLGTMMVPFEAIVVPEYLIVRDLNWLNSYTAQIVPFAASGFSIFFLRQFMLSLPGELRDAATIDGASDWAYLWHIVLPNIRPALATISIYLFLLSWNAFLWPLVVTSGSNTFKPIQIGLADFVQVANGTNWTVVAAAAGFVTLPVLILYFVAQKQITEAITRTGLKG